jgi:hypothetical protein
METPPPVDLNRLKNILGASKKLMNKVESGDFETGHIDSRALNEDGVMQLQAEGVRRPATASAPTTYTEEMVQKSNLPPIIKQAMIERPIPQLSSPNYTFSLDDVSELAEEKPLGLPRTPKTKPAQNIVRESVQHNSDYITISKSQLAEMVNNIVNERLLEFFAKNNNRMVTEEAVKKTVNMLIKEGRLAPKKKSL